MQRKRFIIHLFSTLINSWKSYHRLTFKIKYSFVKEKDWVLEKTFSLMNGAKTFIIRKLKAQTSTIHMIYNKYQQYMHIQSTLSRFYLSSIYRYFQLTKRLVTSFELQAFVARFFISWCLFWICSFILVVM